MGRAGIVSTTVSLVALAVVAASCGADDLSDAPLPSMYTTTTTTTVLTTTTVAVQSRYEVQPGDLLGNIARSYGVSIEELMAANGITNPDKIQAGQVLIIPPTTAPVDTALPAATG